MAAGSGGSPVVTFSAAVPVPDSVADENVDERGKFHGDLSVYSGIVEIFAAAAAADDNYNYYNYTGD